jgi:hypothetical protein
MPAAYLVCVLASVTCAGATPQQPQTRDTQPANECAMPKAEWIWCDDFEQNRMAAYFENDNSGAFSRAAGVGHDGSWGMRAHFGVGTISAGSLKLAFGRTPQSYFTAVDAGTANYRELYWRFFLRNAPGWTGGGGDKLSRITVFASNSTWAQAMIAHVWSGSGSDSRYLVLDPASGTDVAGAVLTTTYNDFDHLRWLGARRGATAIFDPTGAGTWHCIEAHVRLNDPGQSNGVFELWVNNALDASAPGLNWLGSYGGYGLNALFIENYWNAGSPAAQDRFVDRLVVSMQRIGCGASQPLTQQ